jgi:hypothetical protein
MLGFLKRGPKLPTSPARLPDGAKLAVVGESHYQPALRKALRDARQREDHELAIDVFLVHEPDNPYDSNAIAVLSRHGKIGHLSREMAAKYRPVFDRVAEGGNDGVACTALLHPPYGSRPHVGVVLELSLARICLEELG